MDRVFELAILSAPTVLHVQAEVPPATASQQQAAFADGVLRHEPAIRRLVHRLLGWPKASADVDDIVQEVLLLAWRHRQRFRGDAAWSTWLVRIGVNTTRNHQRRHALWRRLFGARDHRNEPTAPVASLDLDAKLAPVRSALADLKHRDRELLVLRYLEQRSIDQIALDLGLSRNAVDVRLSRARERLRHLLPEAPHG